MASKNSSVMDSTIELPVSLVFAIAVVLGTLYCSKKRASEKDDSFSGQQRSRQLSATSNASNTRGRLPSEAPGLKYRMEEESKRFASTEISRRGPLWTHHAYWHLPDAPRRKEHTPSYLFCSRGIEFVKAILRKYDVDHINGFLPSEDPLQRLPYGRYQIWEDLADDLPKLLGARLGQARASLEQLPPLATDKLTTPDELKRAHLLLSLFAHSYVWGGITPKDYIPEGIAKPFWEVSERLGVPAILGHPTIVCYNWRRLDMNGDICMENLSTLNNFFDGRDESWFYLITVEIEARGAASIVPTMLALDAVARSEEEKKASGSPLPFWGAAQPPGAPAPDDRLQRFKMRRRTVDGESSAEEDQENPDWVFVDERLAGDLILARVCVYVTAQLHAIAHAVKGMTESMDFMREGCLPYIFYHRVRPFLSGWKHNPAMPNGLLYCGVSDKRFQFYGGSAAQSALLPFLDITLGVEHESAKSREFLSAMRDYMMKPHREFLKYLESTSSLRPFIMEQIQWLGNTEAHGEEGARERKVLLEELRDAYDDTLVWLQRFRDSHMSAVHEYIVTQARSQGGKDGLENSAGGKGTGGTELMSFLRPLRNDVTEK